MSDHVFWLYWTVLVPAFIFLLFLPMELIAVFTHRSKTDTLSAWVWRLIGTRDGWHTGTTRLAVSVC